MGQTWSGVIAGLDITPAPAGHSEQSAECAAPARYRLQFADGTSHALNEQIGQGFRIVFDGVVVCRYCATESRRSFGGGYCYDCFKTLARCDLCVVSPDRCHYDKGTCREPDWGESFCMQPHTVYLANSSGIKVGITRRGREQRRWLDQGAIQGLPILHAQTRRAAGLVEAQIARFLPDRTDWRKMLRDDVPELDLNAARARIDDAALALPRGTRWLDPVQVERLHYPLPRIGLPLQTLKLQAGPAVGNLIGMKGQYLVLDDGALNVRSHSGYRVTVTVSEPIVRADGEAEQLGLF